MMTNGASDNEHVPSFQCRLQPGFYIGSTVRMRPSRATTRICSPGRRGRLARARHISPLTRIVPSDSRHSTASPSAPIIASRPVMTRRRRARRSRESARMRNPAATTVGGGDKRQRQAGARRGAAKHDDRPHRERDNAAGPDCHRRRDEGLGDHQGKAEQHERGAGIIYGKQIEREERVRRLMPPMTPGSTAPGVDSSNTSPRMPSSIRR